MKWRAEPFGAWVRLDQPRKLVAINRALAEKLGVSNEPSWEQNDWVSPPVEVHLAVNNHCPLPCPSCYQAPNPSDRSREAQPSFSQLVKRLESLAQAGVFSVAFGGGEPLIHPHIGQLGEEAKKLGFTVVMTTSGYGLTTALAEQFTAFDQINVSVDGLGSDYEKVRGFRGDALAQNAVQTLVNAGIRTGVNILLTRDTFSNAVALATWAKSAGVSEVQYLRYKPIGRATESLYEQNRLTIEQISQVYGLLQSTVNLPLTTRIDCAMVPYLVDHISDVHQLKAWGVWGCEAGQNLLSVDHTGATRGCSFLPSSSMSVDRLASEPERRTNRVLALARTAPSLEPCQSCHLTSVCKGGCKAVAPGRVSLTKSDHPRGSHGDPECPRVMRHYEQLTQCKAQSQVIVGTTFKTR